MSNYDDPGWYEQDNQPDQKLQPDLADKFPERIHNDAPGTPPSGMYGAPSQKFPTGQFYTGNTGSPRNRGNAGRSGQIIVSLALVIIAFTGGWFGHQIYSSLLVSSSNQSSYYANLFQQAWSIVDQNYVDRKAVNYQQMSYAAIRSMLAVLNDKGHTYFLTPQEVQAQQQELSGSSSGIGIYINQDPKTKQVIITATVPGAPAEKAGFKSGDIIVAVNHTSVVGKGIDTIHNLIEGKIGTSVAITVQRPPTNQQLTINVTRANFKVPDVIMHYITEAHIADIQILGFDNGVSDELKTDLTLAKKLGATAIVLDLRDNPGGYLQEAINTASEFIQSGNVLLEQDSSGHRTPDPVTGHPLDTQTPIVTLVNGNTASAAEIVSGALQDHKRAVIMGTTTLGTGTVLNEFDLPDGSAIFLGVLEWLTPNGNFIRDKGITPNITVNLNNGANELTANVANQRNMTLQQILASGDNQLATAINYLEAHS
ncbi:MAG TPA: S41 family peptidase [Ktedonobacteraceae bacterium]